MAGQGSQTHGQADQDLGWMPVPPPPLALGKRVRGRSEGIRSWVSVRGNAAALTFPTPMTCCVGVASWGLTMNGGGDGYVAEVPIPATLDPFLEGLVNFVIRSAFALESADHQLTFVQARLLSAPSHHHRTGVTRHSMLTNPKHSPACTPCNFFFTFNIKY